LSASPCVQSGLHGAAPCMMHVFRQSGCKEDHILWTPIPSGHCNSCRVNNFFATHQLIQDGDVWVPSIESLCVSCDRGLTTAIPAEASCYSDKPVALTWHHRRTFLSEHARCVQAYAYQLSDNIPTRLHLIRPQKYIEKCSRWNWYSSSTIFRQCYRKSCLDAKVLPSPTVVGR
jgi:hypothetical protein